MQACVRAGVRACVVCVSVSVCCVCVLCVYVCVCLFVCAVRSLARALSVQERVHACVRASERASKLTLSQPPPSIFPSSFFTPSLPALSFPIPPTLPSFTHTHTNTHTHRREHGETRHVRHGRRTGRRRGGWKWQTIRARSTFARAASPLPLSSEEIPQHSANTTSLASTFRMQKHTANHGNTH